MDRVRVLVVEDSVTVRKRLVEVLLASDSFDVIGEAADGRQAIELCTQLRPHVLTMDMMLPVMTGLAATEYIMAYCPTPILIVSASTNRGELFRTYDALAAGAVDVLEKPLGDEPDGQWEERFRSAVRMVARIRVITHPRARLGEMGRSLTPQSSPRPRAGVDPGWARLLAMGTSTGGPAALVQILRDLPPGLGVPIVAAIHLDAVFGSAFAEWLDAQTPHRVSFARDGERVAEYTGRVAMAPPGRHLLVARGVFHLTSDPPRHSCRPSIDVLFESLAAEFGRDQAACLLTGMGRDGAQGLLAIRRAGGLTIAQDEATSAVFGMPREAALLGAAELVLPLGAIGRTLAATTVTRAMP